MHGPCTVYARSMHGPCTVTKGDDVNLNDRNQMQNDTENEIGRSLFPFIHVPWIVISFGL